MFRKKVNYTKSTIDIILGERIEDFIERLFEHRCLMRKVPFVSYVEALSGLQLAPAGTFNEIELVLKPGATRESLIAEYRNKIGKRNKIPYFRSLWKSWTGKTKRTYSGASV